MSRFFSPDFTKRFLYQHEFSVHDVTKKNFKCNFCELGYSVKLSLNRHIRKAHKNLKIDTSLNDLTQKDGEKKQILTIEEKSDTIIQHKKTFNCRICGLNFERDSTLLNHSFSSHECYVRLDVIDSSLLL